MIIQEEAYLAHYGVKGMKWGERRNRRVQSQLDSVARVRDGGSSRRDRRIAQQKSIYSRQGAQAYLNRGAAQQAKINAGKGRAMDVVGRAAGVNIAKLNYHKDEKIAPLTRQQKQADVASEKSRQKKILAGTVAAIGVVALVSHMDQHPEKYIPAARFAGAQAGKAYATAKKAAAGAKVVFQNNGMVVYAPGQGPRVPMRGLALGR